MTKRTWTLLAVAALVLAVGSSSFAIPSLGGPTGVVSTPTAMIAPKGSLQAAIGYQSLEVAGLAGYLPPDAAWSLQALAGVTDQAELWAAYTSIRDGNDSKLWALGGKLQLTKQPEDDTTLAVGASYGLVGNVLMYEPSLGAFLTDMTAKKVYLVATKDLSPLGGEGWEWGPGGGTKMVGSAGLMYISVDPDLGASESLTRPFLNLVFMGTGGTNLGMEYRWKDNDMDAKAVFSVVLQHAVSSEVTAEIGTTNADPVGLGLDDQDWFVRLAYDIPFGQPGW